MVGEYISREAAIETFELAFDNNWEVSGTLDRIRAIPAADVVEVVRCRECRFAPSGTDDSVEQGFGLEWPDDNWPYHTNPCPYWCEDEYYSHKPKPDFFCAAGKRKDGGQEPPKEEKK